MSLRSALSAASLLGLLLPGCNKDYPNPFPAGGASKPPPAGAALVFTSAAWSTVAGSGRELYSIGADGSNPTRLTLCNTATEACDTETAALAPEGKRAAMTRARAGASGIALVYNDLTRGVEADIAPASAIVSGIDWSVSGEVLAYSGVGLGGLEDIFRADPNGSNSANLTSTATVRERNPRIDLGTSVVAYERIEAGGKAEVFIYVTSTQQARVSPEGPGGALLTGTPYLVGSDANPCFSPDTASLVFRRLTAIDASGLGTWDIVTAKNNGTGFVTLATGSLYRGAPDWAAGGIVFPEVDVAAGTASLVLIQPDGSGRKVLYTQGSRLALSSPRWLRQVAQ
jgi:Tol biopolymer transport system component